jgi:hypothetical protein
MKTLATVIGYEICAAWRPEFTAPYEEPEEVERCFMCLESIPEGNAVEGYEDGLACRCCHNDVVEASREETTAVGVRL